MSLNDNIIRKKLGATFGKVELGSYLILRNIKTPIFGTFLYIGLIIMSSILSSILDLTRWSKHAFAIVFHSIVNYDVVVQIK